MISVDVDILIAYSSKVALKPLLFSADERHIDSWGGTKKTLHVLSELARQVNDAVFYSFL